MTKNILTKFLTAMLLITSMVIAQDEQDVDAIEKADRQKKPLKKLPLKQVPLLKLRLKQPLKKLLEKLVKTQKKERRRSAKIG